VEGVWKIKKKSSGLKQTTGWTDLRRTQSADTDSRCGIEKRHPRGALTGVPQDDHELVV
jgi:hypothetical protein